MVVEGRRVDIDSDAGGGNRVVWYPGGMEIDSKCYSFVAARVFSCLPSLLNAAPKRSSGQAWQEFLRRVPLRYNES